MSEKKPVSMIMIGMTCSEFDIKIKIRNGVNPSMTHWIKFGSRYDISEIIFYQCKLQNSLHEININPKSYVIAHFKAKNSNFPESKNVVF